MESTQNSIPVRQTSTNMEHLQSKPASSGEGRTRSHRMSSTSHPPNHSPNDIRNIDGWIRGLPPAFQDVNVGVMRDMASLALDLFKEIALAAGNSHQEKSIPGVLEQRQKLSLWTNGDSGLDEKSHKTPAVREQIVSNLTHIVLVLSTGITLFTPECQPNLAEVTNRVIEQASEDASLHFKHPASCPPNNILDFCNSIESEITSRIDNLYNLLPSTEHPVADFDEREPRQVEEITSYKRRSFLDRYFEPLRRKAKDLAYTIKPASEPSSTSDSAKYSHRPISNPSKPSTKQSSGSNNSPSDSSLFSHGDAYSSSSSKEGETTFSGLGGLQDHTDSMSPTQIVRIWHGKANLVTLVLLDTGTNDSFILRSHVEKLKLNISNIEPGIFTSFGHTFKVDESVTPRWKFEVGKELHENFRFLVTTKIFDNIGMVLGNVALQDLDIHLSKPKNGLVAQEDRRDLPTQDKEQKQHEIQTRDFTASQAKRRQQLEADYERKLAQINTLMQPRNPTPQQNAAGTSDEQRR